jgi:hypothetical protein
MKLLLKTVAVTAILAMTTASAFAADFDTSSIAQGTDGDADTVHKLSLIELTKTIGISMEQNIGLVSQTGDSNIAYISQVGAGNFTAIIQNATTASVANVGYVFQAGDNNRAVINQR